MSRYVSESIARIAPYVPGEQLSDKKYIKLNTNENPYYTSERAAAAVDKLLLGGLNRYSDPESAELCDAIAEYYGIERENVLVTNGSDEALAFSFMAYCKDGVCFPDVTYGFYEVLSHLYNCNARTVPLKADFTVDPEDYYNCGKTIVLANPNAQTGIALPKDKIELITENNPGNVVIIDQAYADFGGCNATELIGKYKNLLLINTFSKSRSLAGARVGYALADKEIIEDLKKIKNSFHPYNVNRLSSALAAEAIKDDVYFKDCVRKIISVRERLTNELRRLNFEVLPSSANFVLAKSGAVGGDVLYEKLKEAGILVRHFSDPRITDYVRITVGSDYEITELLKAIKIIIRAEQYENGKN